MLHSETYASEPHSLRTFLAWYTCYLRESYHCHCNVLHFFVLLLNNVLFFKFGKIEMLRFEVKIQNTSLMDFMLEWCCLMTAESQTI